mgnify:CR=1 FL=1
MILLHVLGACLAIIGAQALLGVPGAMIGMGVAAMLFAIGFELDD